MCKPFGIHQPIRTCHIRLLFKFIVKSIHPNASYNISTNQKKTYFTFFLKSHSLLISYLSSHNPHRASVYYCTLSPDLGDLFLFLILMGPNSASHNPLTFSLFYLFHCFYDVVKSGFPLLTHIVASHKVKLIVHSTSKLGGDYLPIYAQYIYFLILDIYAQLT